MKRLTGKPFTITYLKKSYFEGHSPWVKINETEMKLYFLLPVKGVFGLIWCISLKKDGAQIILISKGNLKTCDFMSI